MIQIERNIIGQYVNEKDDQIQLLTRSDFDKLLEQFSRIETNQNQQKSLEQERKQQQIKQNMLNIEESTDISKSSMGQQSLEGIQQKQQQLMSIQSSKVMSSNKSGEQSQEKIQQQPKYQQDIDGQSDGLILFFYRNKENDDDKFSQGNQQNNYNNILQNIFYKFINGRYDDALLLLDQYNQPLKQILKAIVQGRINKMEEALQILSDSQNEERKQQLIQGETQDQLYEFLRLYNMGIVYLYKSDFMNAKESFIKAKKSLEKNQVMKVNNFNQIDPSDYYVNYNIAYCNIKLKFYKEARNLLIHESLINKHKDLSFKLLGQMCISKDNYQTKNNYSEAFKYFNDALFHNQNNQQLNFLKATTALIWNIQGKRSNKDNTQEYIPNLEECIGFFGQFKPPNMTFEEKSKAQNNLIVCLIFQGLYEKNKQQIEDIIKDQQFSKDQQIMNNIGNYFSLIYNDRFARQNYEKLGNYNLAKLNLGMLELRSQKIGSQALQYFNESLLNYNFNGQIDSGNVIQSLEQNLKKCKIIRQLFIFFIKVQELEDILPQLIQTYRYWLSQSNIVGIHQKDFIFLFELKLDEPQAFEGFRFQLYHKTSDDNFQKVKIFDYDFNLEEKSKIKNGINLDLNLDVKAIFVKSDKIYQNSIIDKNKNYILFDKFQEDDLIKFIYMEEDKIIQKLSSRNLDELEIIIKDLQQQLLQKEFRLKIILDGSEIEIKPQIYNQVLALKVRYLRFKQNQNPTNELKKIKTQAYQTKEQFADMFQQLNFNQIIFICYQLAIRIKNGGLKQEEKIFLNEYQQIVKEGKVLLNVSQQQFNLMMYWLFKRQPQIKRDFIALKSIPLALKKNFDPIYVLQKILGGQLDVIINKILYKQMNQEGNLIFCCLNDTILNYGEIVNKKIITEDLNTQLKIFKIIRQSDWRICDINTLKYSLKAQDQIIKQYLDKIKELRLLDLTFTQQDVTNFIVVQESKNQAIFKLIFLEHQIQTLDGIEHKFRVIYDIEEFFQQLFKLRDIRQVRKIIYDCFELTWKFQQQQGTLIQERNYVTQRNEEPSISYGLS